MKFPFVLCLATACLLHFTSHAQLRTPNLSGFRNDIQKVVEDFPQGFASIRGELIVKNPQTIEYASTLVPDGVQQPIITEYSSGSKPIYSWQGTVLSTEDFTEAEKKYKWLYHQLKGMNVTYIIDQYTLRGSYDTPAESKSFATSALSLYNPPAPLRKLKVAVTLQFEFPEWKVGLIIYEKEREDEERGELVD